MKTIIREFSAEFIGTLILVTIGCGSVAAHLSMVISALTVSFAFGVALYIGIMIAAPFSGGHVNPIVTVTLASMRKFPLNKVAHYLVAQYLGAFMGAALVYGLYNQTLSKFDEQRMKTNTSDDIYPSRGVFATYPINDINMMTAILDQLVNCAIFMMLIMAATDEKGLNVPKPFIPLAIGLTIIGISVGLGFNCGASLNPARDFAPRLFTLIAGYGSNVFDYCYWWAIGIVAPHIGSLIGGWTYHLLLENSDTK